MSYPVVDLRGARRTDGGPPALRLPASWLYALGAHVHHGLHDRGWLARRQVREPVVSVGALTAGGAGKTPVTRWLASRLRDLGMKPAILSRGYRSSGGEEPRVVDAKVPDARRDGDEPALLARSLPDVPVVVCPDRARGVALARGRGADVLLLDDGFQHRRLHRDADIVLWDRSAEESRGRLIPAGSLREPRSGLRRADLVILIDRGDGAPAPPKDVDPDRIFPARLVSRPRQPIEVGRAVHALSGVANPESFERSLQDLGLRVTGATRHPDHHEFAAAEVLAAANRAADESADFLAVTAKDHVRWPRSRPGEIPVPVVFDLDVEMDTEHLFLDALAPLISGERP